MRDRFYGVCQWLYGHKLMTWGMWSRVYDRHHKRVKDQWRGQKK